MEAVQNPLVVAASLVKVWRLQRALRPARRGALSPTPTPWSGPAPTVEERVRRLVDYRPGPRRAWLTAARRALAVAAVLWTSLFLWSYHGSDRGAELRAVASRNRARGSCPPAPVAASAGRRRRGSHAPLYYTP